MNYKKDKNILNEAMNCGCQTVADLALFLKVYSKW